MKERRSSVGFRLGACMTMLILLFFLPSCKQEEQPEEITRPELVLENFLEVQETSGQEALEQKTIDITTLKEFNPECIGWLDVIDTGISGPLVQPSEDLAYYLSHNFYGEEDSKGCAYTEWYNSTDFSDPNTVIYGRNVDGMFAGLHQYQSRDFFDSHRQIKIYLEDRLLIYRIFAAYTYDDRHLVMSYDFWDQNVFSTYLSDVFSQRQMDAFVDQTMEVSVDETIITLSTGVEGQDEKRYLVQAVLESEERYQKVSEQNEQESEAY